MHEPRGTLNPGPLQRPSSASPRCVTGWGRCSPSVSPVHRRWGRGGSISSVRVSGFRSPPHAIYRICASLVHSLPFHPIFPCGKSPSSLNRPGSGLVKQVPVHKETERRQHARPLHEDMPGLKKSDFLSFVIIKLLSLWLLLQE